MRGQREDDKINNVNVQCVSLFTNVPTELAINNIEKR